jgi:hypothetical protein
MRGHVLPLHGKPDLAFAVVSFASLVLGLSIVMGWPRKTTLVNNNN